MFITCSSEVLSEMVPSGAYVVPLTVYSATTGTSFAEWSTDTCTGKADVVPNISSLGKA